MFTARLTSVRTSHLLFACRERGSSTWQAWSTISSSRLQSSATTAATTRVRRYDRRCRWGGRLAAYFLVVLEHKRCCAVLYTSKHADLDLFVADGGNKWFFPCEARRVRPDVTVHCGSSLPVYSLSSLCWRMPAVVPFRSKAGCAFLDLRSCTLRRERTGSTHPPHEVRLSVATSRSRLCFIFHVLDA